MSSELKITNLKHASSSSNNLVLASDGGVTIKGDDFDGAWTDYYSSSTVTGWSSLTSGRNVIYYKKLGTLISVFFALEGTSNATTVSFTMPYAFITTTYPSFNGGPVWCYDNGSADSALGYVRMVSNSSQVNVYRASGTWTSSGTKIGTGSFTYPTTT